MEIIDCFVLYVCLFVCLLVFTLSGCISLVPVTLLKKKNGWQPIVRTFHFNSLYKNVTDNIPEQRKKSLLELEILNT